jgi:dTDP-4-dehydrorhamnose 3,5-epimerase
MKLVALPLAGAFEIVLEPRGDERGSFARWYDRETFEQAGLPTHWVQGNESVSRRNVVRGLHFQRPPHAETKLVRAVAGAVFDAFVDLRRGSPTYGRWASVELAAEKRNALLVPRGFAHGFCARTEGAVVTYLVDNAYAPQAEGGLAWDDPALGIPWPVQGEPIVSARDRRWPRLADLEPLG